MRKNDGWCINIKGRKNMQKKKFNIKINEYL